MPTNQHHGQPKTLAEAIERLEKATSNKTQEFKDVVGKDYQDVLRAIEDLKPHLEEIGDRVSGHVKETRKSLESKVQEHPWTTLAVVGLVGLVLGWIFGFGNRRD